MERISFAGTGAWRNKCKDLATLMPPKAATATGSRSPSHSESDDGEVAHRERERVPGAFFYLRQAESACFV